MINLNVSYNRIEFIELNSFENLNELKVLNLSFNKLLSIENNLFKGLTSLNELDLVNNFTFSLFNQSFNYLINISGIYLQSSMILENKCIFMHSMERVIKRNVANGTYNFYKSINLISSDSHLFEEIIGGCGLTLEFLQFKIHLNLKTDYQNELFYQICQKNLIDNQNIFNRSYKKCFKNFEFFDYESIDEKEVKKNSIVQVLFGGMYLGTMVGLLLFFLPFVISICLNIFNSF